MPARITVDKRRLTVKMLPGEPYLWLTDPDGDVARDLERRLTNMQRASRGYVRVRTGSLMSTIRKRIRFTKRSLIGELLAGGGRVNYTLVEEEGSRPHEIRPSRRKALRFVVGGQVVFAKSVQIPARRGRPWLYRAMLEVAQPLGWKVTRF